MQPFHANLGKRLIKRPKIYFHSGLDQDLFFYRDNAGREVGLIIHDRDARLVRQIEKKSGYTAKHDWMARLEEIAAILGPYLPVRPVPSA